MEENKRKYGDGRDKMRETIRVHIYTCMEGCGGVGGRGGGRRRKAEKEMTAHVAALPVGRIYVSHI